MQNWTQGQALDWPPLLGLLGASLGAGCLRGGPTDATSGYPVAGIFAENATQGDGDPLSAYVDKQDGQVHILLSDPPPFDAFALAKAACQGEDAYAQNQPYIAHVGACSPEP